MFSQFWGLQRLRSSLLMMEKSGRGRGEVKRVYTGTLYFLIDFSVNLKLL